MREDDKPIFEFSGTDPTTMEAVVEFTKAKMHPHARQQFDNMVSEATTNPQAFVAYTMLRLSEMAQTMNNIGYALQVNGLIKLDEEERTEQ